MELTKKTTILFTEKQFQLLKEIARVEQTSIGELIRSACEKEYGLLPENEAVEAVEKLSQFSLPAGSMSELKQEIISEKPRQQESV